MVTGSVTKMGGELEFFVVLYEDGKIIRMKRFRITDDPCLLAGDVGGYIQEVVTGTSRRARRRGHLGTAPIAADVLSMRKTTSLVVMMTLWETSHSIRLKKTVSGTAGAEERARQEEARASRKSNAEKKWKNRLVDLRWKVKRSA